jgi:hypothetical protein
MVTIMTPFEHALSVHMLPMEIKDDSKYLLCPMPGTLISLGMWICICICAYIYTKKIEICLYCICTSIYIYIYIYIYIRW